MHDKLQILLHRTLDCYELLKSCDFSEHLYSFLLSQEQISQQFSSLSTTAIYHYLLCGCLSADESGAEEELGVICDTVSKPRRLTVKSRRLPPPATCELSFFLMGQLPSL